MAIKSNTTIAGGISASFSRSASALNAINAPASSANRTTVIGNQQAQKSGLDFGQRLQRISNALAKDGNNIHSVAQEFEAIDQKINSSILNSTPILRGGYS
ncbi:TIGR04197 family type VII secretion effector [Enterococcus rivorum]|uniref:Type VII secretion effector n=1 Tax=Enterococcus rivorum TaxID=762845 RepID=A0A1E5KVN7_9ENTE|nr:TIGR04197 family type VII secretion effector [Enterococcus rivorum]MBP2099020.1 type VII secretion effector (TIGR04197 family) [Enterococcus rivorum]OEH81964.1 hypothetical protein BCR26_15075 [Enterococcus rivorum]